MSQDQFQWKSCVTNLPDGTLVKTDEEEALNKEKWEVFHPRKSPPLLGVSGVSCLKLNFAQKEESMDSYILPE